MVRSLVFVVACLMVVPVAAGHAYNHGTRHEDCESYFDPATHGIADGHVHWHHNAPSAGHVHGTTWSPAGHTHAATMHDPCNQVGMQRPAWPNATALEEIPVAAAVIDHDPLAENVILRGEAYKLPVASVRVQDDLIVRGDAELAAMGFPGSGTPTDPYVIAGYHVRNVLMVKDTSACVVVRDNIVHSDAVLGELIDPSEVVDPMAVVRALADRVAELERDVAVARAHVNTSEAAVDAALDELAEAAADLADAQEDAEPWEDAFADAVQERADAAAKLTGAQAASDAAAASLAIAQAGVARQRAALDAAEDRTAAAEDAWKDAVDAHKAAQARFEAFAEDQEPPAAVNGTPDEMTPFVAAYEAFVEAVPVDDDEQDAYDALRAALEDARADVDAGAAALDAAEDAESDVRVALMRARLLEAAMELASRGAADAVEASADALEDADEVLTRARAEYTPYQAAEAEAEAAHAVAKAAFDAARGALEKARAGLASIEADLATAVKAHKDALADVGSGLVRYMGREYASIMDLVDETLEPLIEALDPTDAGRLILDWNGQCVHAYNNVVEDLRVNRNNHRTGYATGGLIEDNRIHTIGQIRHYDGEFRENEVGDRDHVRALMDGSGIHAPVADRAINVDGANQGWFHDNIIMGGVDLDFHGHHHGAGFFAPESHYHGSTATAAYMQTASGDCIVPGHHHGEETTVDHITNTLGVTMPEHGCLPHHDHQKRWTSMVFEDNVLIDPAGKGLRYEDRNHAGDDRLANSEDMTELNQPHFHESDIRIVRNAIVGAITIDVFNAPGVPVWSDDFSEAVVGTTAEETVDALDHVGAHRIPSHPGRNTGYLAIEGNAIHVLGRSHAILATDVDAAERLDVKDNAAWVLPDGWSVKLDRANVTALIADATSSVPTTHGARLGPLGDAGMQTGIELRRAQDSNMEVCGNTMLGFDRGLRATNAVLGSVTIKTCAANDWGTASPAVEVTFTTPPPAKPGITDIVRPVTDPTPIAPVVDPALDDVDDVGQALPPGVLP